MKNAIIGIDLGGTSIKMGLIDQKGDILHMQESPTPVKEGYRRVLDVINHMSEKLLLESEYHWENIVGVGIGVPAFLDLSRGIVIEAVNLGWSQVPLKEEVERMWNVPVMIDNDANAAALGEMWIGAGKGASKLICLTLGTGIGGGVIINGNIYHGVNGSAGEIGHITVREQGGRTCNCGKRGCLETEASATAIALDALEQVRKMSTGPLKEEYDRIGKITAKSVIELANLGDSTCGAILAKAGTVLGKALANMCYLLNPEKIVIGGGMSSAGDLLFDPLLKAFHGAILPNVAKNTHIVAAKLGNQAGMVGSAWLIRHLSIPGMDI
jgi:glucokinase